MTHAQTDAQPLAAIIDFCRVLPEQRDAAEFLLGELPADCRRAVELLYLEAASVNDVARELNLSFNAAVDLIERSMDLLRSMALLCFPELCGGERAA